MTDVRKQSGFTLIEILVGLFLFSVASVGFYQVLFATASGSETARSIARVSEEARLGLNRLVRDAREAEVLLNPTATSYQIEIDFDGDGIEPTPADPAGNYERMIVTWNEAARTISLSNGVTTEVLMRDVDCSRKADNTCFDIFNYSSSRLEWDTDDDGVTSPAELEAQPSVGNGNGILDGQELGFVDGIRYSFVVEIDDRAENFYAEAQMRNQR